MSRRPPAQISECARLIRASSSIADTGLMSVSPPATTRVYSRVAPRIVRIYTLRGFESPRLDHRALGQDRTVLRGVRERPDHRVCRTQASGRPWAEESLLPSDPRARPRLQDRVHPRLPEPAGALRTRIRRGLLKGEQLHALARCVHYGRLGRLDQRDFERQTGAASCLLRILAAIIHWQIREIDRVLSEAGSDADDLNFELLSHISPIGWDNVLLYGEYQLNRSLVRSERLSV